MNFEIIKVFSNNVVLCEDKRKNTEIIAVGCGIGFKAKAGTFISDSAIEKLYGELSEEDKKYLSDIMSNTDSEILDIVEDALKIIDKELKEKLSIYFHLTMLSHLSFAIERSKYGTIIRNPFLEELRVLYPQEYRIAEKFIAEVNKHLEYKLEIDEVGFITMHIHAALRGVKVSETSEQLTLTYELVKVIEIELGHKIDRESYDFIRLLTHLKFAVNRVKNNIKIENILLPEIKKKLKLYYKISQKVAKFAEKNYNILFNEDEVGYITIHLAKIKSKDLDIF
ncbi:PRD domain-containing protein [Sebaldella termitidis]|uniref:PRD domain-containing protein n=1 Tax=Sebaldella termitidis TaxID=826 RepID=UPI003EBA0271